MFIRVIIGLILSLTSVPAFAQWQVPTDYVPIGKGSGKVGFGSLPLSSVGGGNALDRTFYVSKSGNDSKNGLSWATAKLTIQAAITATSTSGKVTIGPGTYTQTAALVMKPNVYIECLPGVTIIQGTSANLNPQWDFTTNTSNGVIIDGCTIDGGRGSNTDGDLVGLSISTANDVTIQNSTLQNFPGSILTITTGTRNRILNNKFSNYQRFAISMITGVFATDNSSLISGNTFSVGGQGVIAATMSNRNIISNNFVYGTLVNNVVVNINGTAVTWVSGPTFANVKSGMFMITGGGNEYFISAVNSTTSLTLSSTAGVHAAADAAFGTGDMIGINSSSDNVVIGNYLTGAATIPISLSNFNGVESSQRNSIVGNMIYSPGSACIGVQSTNNGTQTSGVLIANNYLDGCAQTGAIGSTPAQVGIFLTAPADETNNVFVTGNVVRDTTNSLTLYWLSTAGLSATSVHIGINDAIGMVNAGVNGVFTVGTPGLSATKTIRDAAGTGTCTLIFNGGLLTGGSC